MENNKITNTEQETIIKDITILNTTLYDTETELHNTETQHTDEINAFYFLNESNETDAIKILFNEFPTLKDDIKRIETQIKQYTDDIKQYTDDIQNKREHLKNTLKKSYSLTPTIKDYYIIIYRRDKNFYLLLDKRQNINRYTDINHFFYILYKKHKISKYEFNIYRRYKTLSYNMKSQLNTYLIHKINKTHHKKGYEYLRQHRNIKYNYYDDVTRQNYKIKIDLSHFTDDINAYIKEEIIRKGYIETRIIETIRKTKTLL